MEEKKINWKNGTISRKDMYISDEVGQWQDSKFPKWNDFKPELWFGYNGKGELIYDKFTNEEE